MRGIRGLSNTMKYMDIALPVLCCTRRDILLPAGVHRARK